MNFLKLNEAKTVSDGKVKILIFTEGTILKPCSIVKHFNHSSYIPSGNCVSRICGWHEQGADISYITSCKSKKNVSAIASILNKYSFPGNYLYYRTSKEKYSSLIEMIVPDILIEDDCRSIGGKWQMCITYVKPEIKDRIKSIIVPEFKGIDNLPVDIMLL